VSAAARSRVPRRRWPRGLLVVVLVLAAFAIGVALGQSLSEGPSTGGSQTLVRTLKPLPLAPAARTTLTVTVTGP